MELTDLPFVKAVLDPTLIDGVYNACDQWCDYCPLTARCLAFRCQPAADTGGDIYSHMADAMYESMHALKGRHDAEGLVVPPTLAWLLANDPRDGTAVLPVDDPLERTGRQYVVQSAMYLMSRRDLPEAIPKRADGPTPFDVFVRYHFLIGAKVYRAVVMSSQAARSGEAAARHDAEMAAKVALLLIDRSDEALQLMQVDERHAQIDQLRAQLRRLGRELSARFPEAHALKRPGFDEPDPTNRTVNP